MRIFFTSSMNILNEYTLRYILNHLNYNVVKLKEYPNFNGHPSLTSKLICCKWSDTTFKAPFPRSKEKYFKYVLNKNTCDISKKKVMECFEAVFGYDLHVDPFQTNDLFVVKNNINGKHDGFVSSNKSLTTESYNIHIHNGMVFQKLIHNEINEDITLHYRVPVFFCKMIPLVYEATVLNKHRFKPKNKTTIVKRDVDVFSNEEIIKIFEFCKQMQLDYCELDILRDNHDMKIYIIDANDTPTVTINGYSKEEMLNSIKIQANCFQYCLTTL